MLGDYSSRFLLNICGYIWPAYQCYKALEQKNNNIVREWCVYWFMLALFTTAERMLLDNLLFWVPLYYEAKVIFVIYLWHPKTQGANYLYTRTVQPLLAKHEPSIDLKVEEAKTWIGDFMSAHFQRLTQFVQSRAHLAVAQLQALQQKGSADRQPPGSINMVWPNPQNALQAAMNGVVQGNNKPASPAKPAATRSPSGKKE